MVKILIAGDVAGDLTALEERVAALNSSKHGPFDCVFCVGRFFGEAASMFDEYRDGSRRFPIPLYFIVGDERNLTFVRELLPQDGGEIVPNVYFLGMAGVVERFGLNVSFLSGFEANRKRDREQAEANVSPTRPSSLTRTDMELAARAARSRVGDTVKPKPIDLLLTAQWPQHWHYQTRSHLLPWCPRPSNDEEVDATDQTQSDAAPQTEVHRLHYLTGRGSSLVAHLAHRVAPRYHFAGSEGFFFQRPPYRTGAAPPAPPVCRLIGLGRVQRGSMPKANKYIHALNLEPLTSATAASISTEGATPSPYEPVDLSLDAKALVEQRGYRVVDPGSVPVPRTDKAQRDAASAGLTAEERAALDSAPSSVGNTQFFYDSGRRGRGRGRGAARGPARGGGRGEGQNGARGGAESPPLERLPDGRLTMASMAKIAQQQEQQKRAEEATRLPPGSIKDCWFCPSSPSFQKHIVLSIATEAYVTLPRGGIDEDHILIVPIPHVPSVAAAPTDVTADIERYKRSLRNYYASKGMGLVLFERMVKTIGSVHAHVQCFAVPPRALPRVGATIEEEGKKVGMAFQEIPSSDFLKDAAADGSNYFYAEFPRVSAASVHGGTKEAVGADGPYKPVCLFHRVPEGMKHPMQFGREVMCKILNRTDRLHWKDCKETEAEEEEKAERVRSAFAEFDFARDL